MKPPKASKKKEPMVYFTTPLPASTRKALGRVARLKHITVAKQGREVLNAWAEDNT